MLTYNEVILEHGENVGLAYENLVSAYIQKMDERPELLVLAHYCENMLVTQHLVNRAKNHAKQEIAEAAKHDILPAPKNAVCPRCGADVKWDWDQDIYVVDKQTAAYYESYDALFQGTVKLVCPDRWNKTYDHWWMHPGTTKDRQERGDLIRYINSCAPGFQGAHSCRSMTSMM